MTNLTSRFNTTAILAALAAVFAYGAASGSAMTLAMVLAPLVCGAGWWSARHGHSLRMPGWVVSLLVLLAVIRAAMRVIGTGVPEVEDLTQFLVWILFIKMFDRKTPRDDAHLLGLSVFIAIGAILTSNALLVGVLLVVYFVLATSAAILLQVDAGGRAALERARTAAGGAASDRAHAWRASVAVLPESSRAVRGVTAFACIGMAFGGVLVFVLAPRDLGEGVLGRFGMVSSGPRIGFSPNVTLGQSGMLSLSKSTRPVMDVTVRDMLGENIGGQIGSLYLRGSTLNRYVGRGRWERVVESGAANGPPMQVARGVPMVIGRRAAGRSLMVVEVSLRRPPPRNEAYFFCPWRPVEITFGTDVDPVTPRETIKIDPVPDDGVVRQSFGAGPLGYRVVSVSEYLDDSPTEVRVPRGFDREGHVVREIAERVLTEAGLPVEPAERDAAQNRQVTGALKAYLEKTCVYTLEMVPPDRGEDPIEMFLTRTRRGHCEYFAAALTAMCQSVGLEARMVTGYLTTDYNTLANRFVVRDSNAHAWAEVETQPGRWTTVDASPASEVERAHDAGGGWFSRVRRLYEAVELRWIKSVVTFEPRNRAAARARGDSRDRAVRGMMRGAREAQAWIGKAIRDAQRGDVSGVLGLVGGGILVFGIGLATIVLVRQARAAAHRARAAGAPRDPTDGEQLAAATALFFTRLQAGLADHGVTVRGDTGVLEGYERLLRDRPGIARPVARLTEAYYRVRFGLRPMSAEQQQQAEASVDDVLRSMGRSPGSDGDPPGLYNGEAGRRTNGTVTPASPGAVPRKP